jgi:hypothetical protein
VSSVVLSTDAEDDDEDCAEIRGMAGAFVKDLDNAAPLILRPPALETDDAFEAVRLMLIPAPPLFVVVSMGGFNEELLVRFMTIKEFRELDLPIATICGEALEGVTVAAGIDEVEDDTDNNEEEEDEDASAAAKADDVVVRDELDPGTIALDTFGATAAPLPPFLVASAIAWRVTTADSRAARDNSDLRTEDCNRSWNAASTTGSKTCAPPLDPAVTAVDAVVDEYVEVVLLFCIEDGDKMFDALDAIERKDVVEDLTEMPAILELGCCG